MCLFCYVVLTFQQKEHLIKKLVQKNELSYNVFIGGKTKAPSKDFK